MIGKAILNKGRKSYARNKAWGVNVGNEPLSHDSPILVN